MGKRVNWGGSVMAVEFNAPTEYCVFEVQTTLTHQSTSS